MTPRPSAPAWYVVLVTTAAQMVVAMSNLLLPTIAPKVAESLGVDPVLVGYQVSLTFGVAMVASVYGGVLVLRWGAALMTQISMVVSAAGLGLFALPHVAFIVLGSVAVGAGMGFASPAAAHLLVMYTAPERRNLVFSIKQTGVPVGGVLVALTAPALAVTVGWRWSLAAIAALAVATLVTAERSRSAWDSDRRPEDGVRAESFGGVSLVWRQPSLRWVSLASVLFSVVQRILLTFTVLYLVTEGGYGLVEAGLVLSIAQIGGSVSRIPLGWLADHWRSSLAVLVLVCVVIIVSSVALVAHDASWPKPAVYALFFVLGASALGWNGIFHAECARVSPPGTISVVAGATAFFVSAGVVIGPAAFALAYDAMGSYSTTFGLMVAVGVGTLWLLLLARRQAG